MDAVFKALADRSRRKLLDALRARDGQSLSDLGLVLPGLTRFGVGAHLQTLEEAGLVTTIRQGRYKLHYLNSVPLVEIQDRWLSNYTATTARALMRLRDQLEERMTDTTVSPQLTTVFVIYIRAPRARVWEALTETGTARGWLYGTVTQSDWRPGGRYAQDADGFLMIDGDVITVEEPSRLTIGFNAHWGDDVEHEPAGVLDYSLEEADETGAVTKLTVTLSGLVGATAAAAEADTPRIYSSLKSELETGTAI